jgi:TetR/AcrR family fatty acid metabolism transcriptional regulator
MARRTKEEVLEEFRCATICDAAMTVIARKGVAEATMQDIAGEAGIAKGTLYVYFRDKDELLARTADGAFDRLVTELETAFEAEGTLEERLTGVVLRQLQFFDKHRELFRAYMAISHRDGATHLRKPTMSSYARYRARLEQLFGDAKERGELRDLDAVEVAAVYADCVRGVVVRRIEEKSKRPREEQAALIVSILLRGIQV